METATVNLREGIKLGDRPQKTAVVRESAVEDLLAAYDLSDDERIVGAEILMRQIVSIGEIKGPLDRATFGRLTTADMERLQKAADEVDRRAREDADAPATGD